MKSENLNYNSQIFTLTSLFLHSTSSSINASSRLHHCCKVLLLFFSSDQIRTVGLLLLLLLIRCLITITHGKSKKFLSSLKFRFLFFCLAGLALCPLHFLMNCVDCISVFVNCGLLAFIGLVCLLCCVLSSCLCGP